GTPDVVGRPLRINGSVHTVIGVAPASFRGATNGIRMAVWLPMSSPETVTRLNTTERGFRGMFILGRVAEGVTLDGVRVRLAALGLRLHEEYPGTWTDVNERPRVLTVLPESEARVPQRMRTAILGVFALLVSVVGIVLLIACTNVANLMLAR